MDIKSIFSPVCTIFPVSTFTSGYDFLSFSNNFSRRFKTWVPLYLSRGLAKNFCNYFFNLKMITCRYFEKVRKIRIKNSTILLKRNKLSIEYFDNHHSDIPVYHKYFQMVYFTDFFWLPSHKKFIFALYWKVPGRPAPELKALEIY